MKPICVFEHETVREPLPDREKAVTDRLRGPGGEKMFEVGWHGNTGMEYPNLRRVEWRVTKPVPSPVKFARQTISRLKRADFDKICVAYMKNYPNDNELSQAIASLQPRAPHLPGPEPNLLMSRFNLARSLNRILCGLPGTRKTWSALHELR